jgi:LuxR family maltose regulon positive regulatory protein
MDEPLLQTKLYVPMTRPDPATRLRTSLVPRPHLVEQLDEGLPGKLTLISAPAGFGKTTLVSSWLEHVNLPAAWLSLDEDDNDWARFWTYFIAALQTIQPEVGTEVLALLQSSPLPPSHTLLTLLINGLTAISERFILVLDDYHTIETETIDQALDFFIEHLPPLMHLVLTSRVDPNLSLARLRASGQLNELRSADLRFTPAETTRFLEHMTGLSLTAAEVAALDRRTEGWIAGLQMAALSLQQREAAAVSQFIAEFSGSHRYIMDYLVDEVLQGQPAEVQTFLLYTSILDRLCGPLCEAILRGSEAPPGNGLDFAPPPEIPGASRAQELLAYLEHANLFIHPLDDQRHWYRYHPLFADLLRQRLQQAYPDRVAPLHLSASEWYEQAGLTGPAVRHALAAQAYGRAAMLVEQVAPAMVQRSELARLLTWLGALPQDEVQARPLLALYYAWGLFLSGQIEQAATRLEAVEAMLEADEAKQTPEVLGHTAAMRAYLAREAGDFAATIALSRQALAHLPEQDALLRAMVTLNLAVAHYLQGQFEPAYQLLTEIIATGQTAQRIAPTLSAIYLNTQLLRARGALGQALQLCQEGLELVARRGWQDFPAVGFVYVAFGDLLRERNELSTAAEYLEKGIELGQAGGHHHILTIGNVWMAWLRQTQGDVTGSHEAIRAALQFVQYDQGGRFWPLPPAACQARLWIAQGDLAAASRWAQVRGLTPADSPITYHCEVEYLTLARLLIAEGKLEAAETLLLRLHRGAASAGRNGNLIEILILQAITFAAQDRGEEALSALAQALSLAEPEGFVRIFLDEGAPMVALLRRAVAQDLHAPYALHLLGALGEAPAIPQPLIEPLSERELEVLRRVVAGYSNQEIAQDLVVAVSTVKRHISNIYGKLEVGSRTQAVARARELGLL